MRLEDQWEEVREGDEDQRSGGRRLEMESKLIFCGRELEARVSWRPEDRWEEVGEERVSLRPVGGGWRG